MKFIWEETDIVGGRKYNRDGLTEIWMIGYQYNEAGNQEYVSISLTDGIVTIPSSKPALAADLTMAGYVPCEFLNN